MDEFKKLIGKPLYFEGTGNNAPRGKGKRDIRTGTITKVARVFVTVHFDGHFGGDRFRVSHSDNKRLYSYYNSGWKIYESEQEMNDRHEAQGLAEAICCRYQNSTAYAALDITTIRKVAELLGAER